MPTDEHTEMLACQHKEADRLGPICLFCGRISLPDPSYIVVAVGFVMLAWNVYWWWAL